MKNTIEKEVYFSDMWTSGELYFDTRKEAEQFVEDVNEYAKTYGIITIRDLDDLLCVKSWEEDSCFGWELKDLTVIKIQKTDGCYKIFMPPVNNLKDKERK